MALPFPTHHAAAVRLGRATLRMPAAALLALQELAGPGEATRRALCRGLLRGQRRGLSGGALALAGFAALEAWHRGRPAAS